MNRFIHFFNTAFPLWILLCSFSAMLYPGLFTWFQGDFIAYGLGIIMLGMGLTLQPDDFRSVFKTPLWVLTGSLLQFTVMPFFGWMLGYLFNLPGPLAVGLIIVSCCPGGTASNVITFLARANVALSVAMTAVSTILAIILTPLLSSWLIGNRIEVNPFDLFLGTLKVVLLPVAAGVILNRYFPVINKRIVPFAPPVAIVAIVLIVSAIIGQGRKEIIQSGLNLLGAVFCLHMAGFLLGYFVTGFIIKNERVKETISIEVGMQNSGLGAYLARANFANPAIAIPSAISSAMHSILGSIAAWIFRRKTALSNEPTQEVIMRRTIKGQ